MQSSVLPELMIRQRCSRLMLGRSSDAYRTHQRYCAGRHRTLLPSLIERHSRSGVPLELTIVHTDVREPARNGSALARQTQAKLYLPV